MYFTAQIDILGNPSDYHMLISSWIFIKCENKCLKPWLCWFIYKYPWIYQYIIIPQYILHSPGLISRENTKKRLRYWRFCITLWCFSYTYFVHNVLHSTIWGRQTNGLIGAWIWPNSPHKPYIFWLVGDWYMFFFFLGTNQHFQR